MVCMNSLKGMTAVLLTVLLLSSVYSVPVQAADTYSDLTIQSKIEQILDYKIKSAGQNSVQDLADRVLAQNAGDGAGDWYMIALSRYGIRLNKSLYRKNLASVIFSIYETGIEHVRVTELQRMALAYTASGGNVRDISGKNLLADASYGRGLAYLNRQGILALDYALIVLDSGAYAVPKNAQTTRDEIVNSILSRRLSDGGFALTGSRADTDVTAMTVTALAPYYKKNEKVRTAVDAALSCLSDMQKDDGTFTSYGKKNSESCAQAAVALTALGIDPQKDSRFIKNGVSALDAMFYFQKDSGGFSHLENGQENDLATYQALYALVAYYSFLKGMQGLYNFTDESNPQVEVTEPPQTGEKQSGFNSVGSYSSSNGGSATDKENNGSSSVVQSTKNISDASQAVSENTSENRQESIAETQLQCAENTASPDTVGADEREILYPGNTIETFLLPAGISAFSLLLGYIGIFMSLRRKK